MTKSKSKIIPAAAATKGDLSSKVRVGIIGLPNVGKSSLFNALVRRSQAQAENFPFCTIDPNVANIAIPDPYLGRLAQLAKSQKTVPAMLEFVDVAGLVSGASRGEGLGNKFLANIREVDAIIHLLRNYDDNRVVHVDGRIDPVADAEVVNTELQLADIAHVERRLEKSNCKGEERNTLELLLPRLNEGVPARSCDLSAAAQFSIKSMGLLSLKPVIYAFNVSRNAFLFERTEALAHAKVALERIRYCDADHDLFALVSAKMEARMAKLEENDRLEHLHKFGVQNSMDAEIDQIMCYNALPILIQKLLDLGLLYTGPGVPPSRSSTTRAHVFRQAGAPTTVQMAGRLHGDIQKGFIKAEVISAPTLLEYPSYSAAKDSGRVRTEGKEHVLHCDDVILIKWK